MTSNRRSFLKMLFGGAAAAVVAPTVVKAESRIKSIVSAFVDHPVPPRPHKVFQPWCMWDSFDVDAGMREVTFNTTENFLLQRLDFNFDESTAITFPEAQDAMNNMCFEFLVGDKLMMRSALALMSFGFSRPGSLSLPVSLGKGVSCNLHSEEHWTPPKGIRGQIVMHGVQVIEMNDEEFSAHNARIEEEVARINNIQGYQRLLSKGTKLTDLRNL